MPCQSQIDLESTVTPALVSNNLLSGCMRLETTDYIIIIQIDSLLIIIQGMSKILITSEDLKWNNALK